MESKKNYCQVRIGDHFLSTRCTARNDKQNLCKWFIDTGTGKNWCVYRPINCNGCISCNAEDELLEEWKKVKQKSEV